MPSPLIGRRAALRSTLALLGAGGLVPWARAAAADTQRGWAIPIGGGLKSSHDAVWERLVALAGGRGSRFVVFGTASESPLPSSEAAAEQLLRRGAQTVILPVSPLLKDRPIAEAVRDPAFVEVLRDARGVFFTGGSQDRIVDGFLPGGKPSPLLEAVWGVLERGGVVAGTSAGAAIMSRTMFRDAPNVLGVMKGRFAEGKEWGAGLGFVGDRLFVDQHFLKRGRLGRMLPLMHARGLKLGLGVEEDSAAAVRGDRIDMLGGSAMLVDLSEATSDERAGAFNLRGARLSLLQGGDSYDMARRELTPSEDKRRGQFIDPAAPGYKPYYTEQAFHVDMLGDGTLATAMGMLIDARYDEVRGLAFDPRPVPNDPLAALGFEFRLYKTPGALGWYSETSAGEDYTVHRLGLDVAPVRLALPLYQPWSR